MLNPTDTNISELDLNILTLKFKDKILEKKYNKEKKKNTLLARILYFFSLFIFTVYSLLDMFLEETD